MLKWLYKLLLLFSLCIRMWEVFIEIHADERIKIFVLRVCLCACANCACLKVIRSGWFLFICFLKHLPFTSNLQPFSSSFVKFIRFLIVSKLQILISNIFDQKIKVTTMCKFVVDNGVVTVMTSGERKKLHWT